MALQNSLRPQTQQKTGITQFLNSNAVVANIEQAIGKDNKQRFITGVVSAVNNNPSLKNCTNQSILVGALLGESLKLSPSPQLGHYYLVPFKNKKEGTETATFQLGYKGYVQLAIRSGQYKKLTVVDIKEGELVRFDAFNEEIEVNMIDDPDEREKAKTIGYYAMFELVNGYRKAIYWSKKKMIAHADKYSPAFSANATTGKYAKVSFEDYEAGKYPESEAWLYSSFWYKDFDGMAYKTMLRQLISKWGIMSIEMQSAFENDMTYTDESGNRVYAESEDNIIDAESSVVSEITTDSVETENVGSASEALFK